MTAREFLLGIALAAGLVATPQSMAGGPGRIPLPSGHFSFTAQGTEASCAAGPCVVLNIIETGHMVRDAAGNACGSHAAVVNTVPPTAAAPIVVPNVMTVLKPIRYDPGTGTGDAALTEYIGGTCNGASFDASGATLIVSGTLHFTVSSGETGNGGDRIDSIVTALDIPGTGGYSITFTERQQKSTGN